MSKTKRRELQTLRLFATLGLLTLLVVLLFKVVLFGPALESSDLRGPASNTNTQGDSNNLNR